MALTTIQPALLSIGAPTWDSNGSLTVVLPTGSVGYGTGAGGTVTQLTSKSTAVTLNKPTGQVTMNNAALAAGAVATFSLNCSVASSKDLLLITPVAHLNYSFRAAATAEGIFAITIKNESGVSLSEAVFFNFAIIKGATS